MYNEPPPVSRTIERAVRIPTYIYIIYTFSASIIYNILLHRQCVIEVEGCSYAEYVCACFIYTSVVHSWPAVGVPRVGSFRTNEGDSYCLEKASSRGPRRESKQTAPAAATLTSGRNKRDWIMAHFVSITMSYSRI